MGSGIFSVIQTPPSISALRDSTGELITDSNGELILTIIA